MSEKNPAPSFAELGLDDRLCEHLGMLEFVAPTPVQAAAIPHLLAGHDLLAQAATGTGKTAAFGLPLIVAARQRPGAGAGRPPCGLVLVPTRELAGQVGTALTALARGTGLRVATLTGGAAMREQRQALAAGADLVVATPGRLLDHLRRGSLAAGAVAHLVLDEADEMLDMGFAEDLEAIFAALPERRQTALLSATLPPRIAALARRHLREPKIVSLGGARAQAPGSEIVQWAHGVERADKFAALMRVLETETPTSCIVFCRTRGDVDRLEHGLAAAGSRVGALHGGMDQPARDHVMGAFRAGELGVLVATDVAARGLDVEHVSHVVNFDMPGQCDTYVHRIGRTGRAGRGGSAISLVERGQARALGRFAQILRADIPWRPLPSGADAQARRAAGTRARLEALAQRPLADHWGGLSGELAGRYSAADLAGLVIKLAAGAGDGPAADIPSFDPAGRAGAAGHRRGPAGGGARAQLFVGLGRRGGLQPRDLVDCMREVGHVDARTIGRIDMGANFSLVEVPAAALAGIVANMRGLRVDGRAVVVRPDRGAPGPRHAGA